MTHILLDTDVVIDFLIDRRPFSLFAASLFDYSEKRKIKLYITAVSYNNIYYIVKKLTSHAETIKTLKGLESLTETIDTGKDAIQQALSSEFKDFEDAIQYFSALSINKIDLLVTRNIQDFKHSNIPILTPDQAISFIKSGTK